MAVLDKSSVTPCSLLISVGRADSRAKAIDAERSAGVLGFARTMFIKGRKTICPAFYPSGQST